METRRWWWWGGGIAAAVLMAAVVMFARRQPVDVDIASVRIGPLRVTVEEAATVRVRRHADVSAPITGRFVPGDVRVGDSVRAGTTVGALYPAPLDRSAQEQARAQLGAAEAAQREAETRVRIAQGASDDARRSLQRTERLVQAGALSPQDLERAQTAVDAAASDLDAAKFRVNEAAYALASTRAVVESFTAGRAQDAIRLVATAPGRVLRVYEEHERVVPAGTPLVQVGDPRDLELVIPLLSTDATRVKIGADVRFVAGAPGDTLVGHVTLVEPSAFTKISALGVEEQRVNVIATVPRLTGLGDQYRVDAHVTVWEAPRVTLVPTGALVRDGEKWSVFVVDGAVARRRDVEPGERGSDLAEVRKGLSGGERVVVYPGDRVADGIRVRPRR